MLPARHPSPREAEHRPSLDRRGLLRIYRRLYAHYGPQHWWPAESPWEIMVGAILTQNTSWKNVEKALANLKRAGCLEPSQLNALEVEQLAALIRPAGFTSTKPERLKKLAEYLLAEYGGDPDNLRGGELATQRAQLLALKGIGPETADAILLYVAGQPIFVVDAYTRRIMARLGYLASCVRNRTPHAEAHAELTDNKRDHLRLDAGVSYEELQQFFMTRLPHDPALFNEFHALLDVHAKYVCTKRAPRCRECPLRAICLQRGVE
jgi:endonuclease III related protein